MRLLWYADQSVAALTAAIAPATAASQGKTLPEPSGGAPPVPGSPPGSLGGRIVVGVGVVGVGVGVADTLRNSAPTAWSFFSGVASVSGLIDTIRTFSSVTLP